jgi:hypothetical protein
VLPLITGFLAALRELFGSGVDTPLEVLALRQQLAMLKRKRPGPSLNRFASFGPLCGTCGRVGPMFWSWSKPETVIGWHRAVAAGAIPPNEAYGIVGR